jgi:hypothetical protein
MSHSDTHHVASTPTSLHLPTHRKPTHVHDEEKDDRTAAKKPAKAKPVPSLLEPLGVIKAIPMVFPAKSKIQLAKLKKTKAKAGAAKEPAQPTVKPQPTLLATLQTILYTVPQWRSNLRFINKLYRRCRRMSHRLFYVSRNMSRPYSYSIATTKHGGHSDKTHNVRTIPASYYRELEQHKQEQQELQQQQYLLKQRRKLVYHQDWVPIREFRHDLGDRKFDHDRLRLLSQLRDDVTDYINCFILQRPHYTKLSKQKQDEEQEQKEYDVMILEQQGYPLPPSLISNKGHFCHKSRHHRHQNRHPFKTWHYKRLMKSLGVDLDLLYRHINDRSYKRLVKASNRKTQFNPTTLITMDSSHRPDRRAGLSCGRHKTYRSLRTAKNCHNKGYSGGTYRPRTAMTAKFSYDTVWGNIHDDIAYLNDYEIGFEQNQRIVEAQRDYAQFQSKLKAEQEHREIATAPSTEMIMAKINAMTPAPSIQYRIRPFLFNRRAYPNPHCRTDLISLADASQEETMLEENVVPTIQKMAREQHGRAARRQRQLFQKRQLAREQPAAQPDPNLQGRSRGYNNPDIERPDHQHKTFKQYNMLPIPEIEETETETETEIRKEAPDTMRKAESESQQLEQQFEQLDETQAGKWFLATSIRSHFNPVELYRHWCQSNQFFYRSFGPNHCLADWPYFYLSTMYSTSPIFRRWYRLYYYFFTGIQLDQNDEIKEQKQEQQEKEMQQQQQQKQQQQQQSYRRQPAPFIYRKQRGYVDIRGHDQHQPQRNDQPSPSWKHVINKNVFENIYTNSRYGIYLSLPAYYDWLAVKQSQHNAKLQNQQPQQQRRRSTDTTIMLQQTGIRPIGPSST